MHSLATAKALRLEPAVAHKVHARVTLRRDGSDERGHGNDTHGDTGGCHPVRRTYGNDRVTKGPFRLHA